MSISDEVDFLLKGLNQYKICKVVRETPHGIFMVDPTDGLIGRALISYGEFEYQEKRDWFKYIPAGKLDSIFIDIGANIGTTSIPLILDNLVGKTIAIEPDPNNFYLFSYNIKANDLEDHITPIQCALNNFCGTVKFEKSVDNYGDHRVRYKDNSNGYYNENNRKVIDVSCMTLDSLVKQYLIDIDKVIAVKCDTQGSEGFIMEGAKVFLQTKLPWIIEFSPYLFQRSGYDREKFIDMISDNFSEFIELNPYGKVERHKNNDL